MARHVKAGVDASPSKREWGESHKIFGADIGAALINLSLNVLVTNSPGPYHSHSNADNAFFIIEGQARFRVEGQTYPAGPGDAVFIPMGERHDVTNVGKGDLRLLDIKTPGNYDQIVDPAGPESEG